MLPSNTKLRFSWRSVVQAALMGVLMAATPLAAQPILSAGSCGHTGLCRLTGSCGFGACGLFGACGDSGSSANAAGFCVGSPDYLGSAPTMFGDFLTGSGTQLRFSSVLDPVATPQTVDLTIGGGPGRVKIADNNKALPQDRFYFNFNYFNNVVHVQPRGVASGQHLSFNRYTIGIEKAFFCDQHSLELRVPFTQAYVFEGADFGVRADSVDNLTAIYKYLLDVGGMDETGSVVTGVGINIPTGDDTEGTVGTTYYEIQNQAVNVMPYLGFLGAEDATFFHLFVQLDLVAKGNPVLVQSGGVDTPLKLGTLNDQNLINVDVSLGQWLFPDCYPPPVLGFSGVAGIVELHYTSTLRDADEVTGTEDGMMLEFSNFANRVNVFNVTAGLYFEFGSRLDISMAGALPLRGIANRSYDAQVMTQVNYHF